MTNDKELAMIAAHQRGRNIARDNNQTRDAVLAIARNLTIHEGDALIAGYYAERRRIDMVKTILR